MGKTKFATVSWNSSLKSIMVEVQACTRSQYRLLKQWLIAIPLDELCQGRV